MFFLDFLTNRKTNKELDRLNQLVPKIENESDKLSELSDEEFYNKVDELKQYFKNSSDIEINLKKISDEELIRTISLIREATYRTLGYRHYPVQILGGLSLIQCTIAEMKTGEGKTITAVIPVIYYALKTKKQIHVVTANEYLAERDAKQLEKLYQIFGLSVAANFSPNERIQNPDKSEIFNKDIVYSSAYELATDFLRGETATTKEKIYFSKDKINFVLIDEADFVLLDSATNSILLSENVPYDTKYMPFAHYCAKTLKRSYQDPSGYTNQMLTNTKLANMTQEEVEQMNKILADGATFDEFGNVIDGDFYLDSVIQKVTLFESAYDFIDNELEKYPDLQDQDKNFIYAMVEIAIVAEHGLKRDKHYIVTDNKVIIINPNTGRPMFSSRWNNGLHQAVEFKENVDIKSENKNIASITFQSFFNQYRYKAGMTGTAKSSSEELQDLYGLTVVVIPTNKPSIRKDLQPIVFIDDEALFNYLIETIKEKNKKQQPILIGTPNIYMSELIAIELNKNKLPFNLLNAKNIREEAKIIAEAGQLGAITISTNMAGRGTDILLGGDIARKQADLKNLLDNEKITVDAYEKRLNKIISEWKVQHDRAIDAGGLCVISVGINENKRIDNQLYGRAGRQGEAGETLTLFSLEDGLVKNTMSELLLKNIAYQMVNLGVNSSAELPHQYSYVSKHWLQLKEKVQERVNSLYVEQRAGNVMYENINEKRRGIVSNLRQKAVKCDDSELIQLFDETLMQYVQWQIKELNIDYEEIENNEAQSIVFNIVNHFNQFNVDKIEIDATINEEISESLLVSISFREIKKIFDSRFKGINEQDLNNYLRNVFLVSWNEIWHQYLTITECQKLASQLAVYAQKIPKIEFLNSSHETFTDLLQQYPLEVIKEVMETDKNQLLSNETVQ